MLYNMVYSYIPFVVVCTKNASALLWFRHVFIRGSDAALSERFQELPRPNLVVLHGTSDEA